MHSYETVTEALADLKARGFTTDFNIAFDSIKCSVTQKCLYPDQFEIVEHHRFEGTTDPGDESIVYAVQEKYGDMKGVLVSAYGVYADRMNDILMRKLAMNE